MGSVSAIRRAISLPWLCPAVSSVLSLTEDPPHAGTIQSDPALILHLFRFSWPTPDSVSFQLDESTLSQPGLCEEAATLLEHPQSPEPLPQHLPAHRAGLAVAHTAAAIAERTGVCSPDAAWSAGLLVPLGWYALAAADYEQPDSATAIRIGRRLAGRWRLPTWLSITIGFPDSPTESAVALGAHAGLYRVVRAAEAAVAERYPLLQPYLTMQAVEDAELALIAKELTATLDDAHDVASPMTTDRGLLARLLRATAKARARSAAVLVSELEATVDRLTAELAVARQEFDHTLRDAKLDALAEFAAGASHEINNPLAVIAGNAQLLEARETDPDKRKSLAAVRRQTKRIHDILLGARQFARPPLPTIAPMPLADFVRESVHEFETVVGLLGGDAPEVQIPHGGYWLNGDRGQLRHALNQLLRNAFDAAGNDGSVRVSAEVRDNHCEVSVEDSGRGPDPAHIIHLFDPFFSGRSAGRGRGLGLSIAWQFARQNGGDVRYAPRPGRPSRFVLTIPLATNDQIQQTPERLSA